MTLLHALAAVVPLLNLLPLPHLVAAQLTAATTGGPASVASGVPANRPTQPWTQWQPKPSYPVTALPDQYMGQDRLGTSNSPDQTGFNTCTNGTNAWNQQSKCQTAWVNSLEDFCLWGPPTPDTIGSSERQAVAYCTRPTHGTRLIPDGTITSAHFVQTSEYVQVTGVGDFTSIGIPLGDAGGEMDSAGMDDLSNPIGGVVYTTAKPSANGRSVMATEWTNFMSWNQFCFRVCFGNNAEQHCQHIYDILGCRWNIPANYDPGVFETCDGALAPFQGIYTLEGGQVSTFQQGQPITPDPHPAPSSSNCRAGSSVNNGGLLVATPLHALASQPTGSASGMTTSFSASTSSRTGGSSGSASGSGTKSAASTNFKPICVGVALAAGAAGVLAVAALL
ncbi:hypothetical protein K437DRAFT_137144 [Tilletiaria anomala UBC 951]|uniref:Macrofage activating glyco protein n=1 Tax=Tilletiaria anomala (strain ATCC 24038 / CBS 436.72 / UBC 951) TaxID=1037660 RepID=A0A066VSR6_TILAU|nr:uncharacterized protein K437DRAFT_137144 [Tilletiaria anomala UBC 951]KDN44501.1 hypothetical protein K437DRAFT_137144 [Tilletiaria anomala UBC 951]